MKVYDKMPSGLDCPIVGINISDPSVVCTANIAPANPHHTLPIYRRFWSSAYPYETPGWASLVGANPDLCATQYVLSVRPNIPGMALMLEDSSMDSVVAAALLGLQENDPGFASPTLASAIEEIRGESGNILWLPGMANSASFQVRCLRSVCESTLDVEMKVRVARDWLIHGTNGRYNETLISAGEIDDRSHSATRSVTILRRDITDRTGATKDNLPHQNHFSLCVAYMPSHPIESLVRRGFDHAPVVIAATDRRYSIGVHPGATVALDVPRLLDRLEQMEGAALAYEKPREAVMAYLAKQPTGWRVENHRITASSLLHSAEVMEAVWACMLGSKKLPAWRAGGQSVKTE